MDFFGPMSYSNVLGMERAAEKFISLDRQCDIECMTSMLSNAVDDALGAEDETLTLSNRENNQLMNVLKLRKTLVQSVKRIRNEFDQVLEMEHELQSKKRRLEAQTLEFVEKLRQTTVPYPELMLDRTMGQWHHVFKAMPATVVLGKMRQVCKKFKTEIDNSFVPLTIDVNEEDETPLSLHGVLEALCKTDGRLERLLLRGASSSSHWWSSQCYVDLVQAMRKMYKENEECFHGVKTLSLPLCSKVLHRIGMLSLMEKAMPNLEYLCLGERCLCKDKDDCAWRNMVIDVDEDNHLEPVFTNEQFGQAVYTFGKLQTLVTRQHVQHLFDIVFVGQKRQAEARANALLPNVNTVVPAYEYYVSVPKLQTNNLLSSLDVLTTYNKQRAFLARHMPHEINVDVDSLPFKMMKVDDVQPLFYHPDVNTINVFASCNDTNQLDNTLHRYGFKRVETKRKEAYNEPNLYRSGCWDSQAFCMVFQRSREILDSLLRCTSASRHLFHSNGCSYPKNIGDADELLRKFKLPVQIFASNRRCPLFE